MMYIIYMGHHVYDVDNMSLPVYIRLALNLDQFV